MNPTSHFIFVSLSSLQLEARYEILRSQVESMLNSNGPNGSILFDDIGVTLPLPSFNQANNLQTTASNAQPDQESINPNQYVASAIKQIAMWSEV